MRALPHSALWVKIVQLYVVAVSASPHATGGTSATLFPAIPWGPFPATQTPANKREECRAPRSLFMPAPCSNAMLGLPTCLLTYHLPDAQKDMPPLLPPHAPLFSGPLALPAVYDPPYRLLNRHNELAVEVSPRKKRVEE